MKNNQKSLITLGIINIPLSIAFIVMFVCSFINFNIAYLTSLEVILWVFSAVLFLTIFLINTFIILLIGCTNWGDNNSSKTCAWVLCLISLASQFLPGIIALYWACSVVGTKKANLSSTKDFDDKLKEIKDILNK